MPGSCTNGTIDWNYPKEYVIIHFKGEGHAQYSVCLGGNLGGDMFTLYDVTGDTKQAIPKGVHVLCTFRIAVLAVIANQRTIQYMHSK